jgi:HK97 family phage portal protein
MRGARPELLSPISYARETLGVAVAQRQFAANFIHNQAAPSGILTVKPGITPDGMKRLRGEVETMYTGARKAGRVMIADDSIDWKPLGVTPADAEFLAQRRFTVEQICRIFGVPPQMVGDTSKQTFANFEQAGLNFLALAILPWVTRFEQEANRKLFARAVGRRPQPFVKLNTSAIVRADLERRNRSYALGRQWGWLSANDIRRLEDMEPIGPEGDVYLLPMNMEPLPPPVPGDSPPQNVATLHMVAE